MPVDNTSSTEVIGGEFQRNLISRQDLDEVLSHLAAYIGEYFMGFPTDFQLYSEH